MRQEGGNLESIQESNRHLVLKFMYEHDIVSRTDLSNFTGLKLATITNIVNDFINWGLIEETGLVSRGKGKRHIGIRLIKEKYKVISVRFSRNYIKLLLTDMSKNIYITKTYSYKESETLRNIIDKINSGIVNDILPHCERSEILGVGVAIPGPWVDDMNRVVYFTGMHNWHNVSIVEALKKELDFKVFIGQDANMALLSELKNIEELDKKVVLLVMAGQGVGGAIANKGEIMKGTLGTAGEIGHMSLDYKGEKCSCGNRGCLENLASSRAIIKKVKEEINKGQETSIEDPKSIKSIIKAYKEKDSLATMVINEAAKYIGYALANLTNVLNPSVVYIGDEVSESGQEFLKNIKKYMFSRVQKVVYENVELRLMDENIDPALLGTVDLVVYETIKHPTLFEILKEN